jgi:hypothetical protein
MNNPLQEPVPEGTLQRVRAVTVDLAYGASEGFWAPEYSISRSSSGETWFIHDSGSSTNDWQRKWGESLPPANLLVSFGYSEIIRSGQFDDTYLLTEKAFSLLEQPIPTSIFISYRRQESSAFALLVLARLKALGLEPFLDVNIEPGDEWHPELEAEVNRRENFICLVGPKTLESEYVRREITWALAANARIIPIWHNGFDGTKVADIRKHYPGLGPFLDMQAIKVEREDTDAYQSVITRLLNRFGVTP